MEVGNNHLLTTCSQSLFNERNLHPKKHSSKKLLFWPSPYKTEVLTASLIETLELSKFGHMTTSTMLFVSRDKILLMTSWTKIIRH